MAYDFRAWGVGCRVWGTGFRWFINIIQKLRVAQVGKGRVWVLFEASCVHQVRAACFEVLMLGVCMLGRCLFGAHLFWLWVTFKGNPSRRSDEFT